MAPHTGNFVSYLRVSTHKQGAAGLGVEAQRAAAETFLNGGRWKLVTEFVEVESGKRSSRPKLTEALAACRRRKATLVIAKLDRLARNVHFITGLMESGVDFVAADCPNDDRMMLQMRAVFAEEEARKISIRTKAALAVAKARGVKLGGCRGAPAPDAAAGAASIAARQEAAANNAADYADTIRDIQEAGTTSANGLAAELNRRGITTPRGGRWQALQVQRLLARLA
jgi:DNA invertase Pin-like site-specific DNA recombinase